MEDSEHRGPHRGLLVTILLIGVFAIALIVTAVPNPAQNQGRNLSTTIAPVGPAILTVSRFNAAGGVYFNAILQYASITLANGGGQANNVQITLTSRALISPQIPSGAIFAGSEKEFQFELRGNDVDDGVYPVNVTVSYSDINGFHQQSLESQQVTLVPSVKITDVTPAKYTIGTTDSTIVRFRVQSLSSRATYSNMLVGAFLDTIYQSGCSGKCDIYNTFNVSPDLVSVGVIPPLGTSDYVQLTLSTIHATTGQYAIQITITADNEPEVAIAEFRIMVSG